MELQIPADSVKDKVKKDSSGVVLTIADERSLDFLNSIMGDPLVAGFLNSSKAKGWLATQIGVKGLLESYSKEEVLKQVGWDYVKEFFMDHMNPADILNKLGWEVVREHFADKINALSNSQNDINNNAGNKSILETLDEGNNQ